MYVYNKNFETIKFILLWQKRIIFKLHTSIQMCRIYFWTVLKQIVTLHCHRRRTTRALFPKCMSTFNSLLSTRHPHTRTHSFTRRTIEYCTLCLLAIIVPFLLYTPTLVPPPRARARHSNVKNVRTCFKCFTAQQRRRGGGGSALAWKGIDARAPPFKSHVRNKMCHPNRRRRTFRV